MDDVDVKKECPSCGLGVALDSTVCEFCGWDFEEEDEWILQIEKLERDLMLEKQKFEPGTMDSKIESTIHTPAIDRIEIIKSKQNSTPVSPAQAPSKPPAPQPKISAPKETPIVAPASKVTREARPSELPVQKAPEPKMIEPETAQPTPPKQVAPPGKVKRVRTLKSSSAKKVSEDGKDAAARKAKQ